MVRIQLLATGHFNEDNKTFQDLKLKASKSDVEEVDVSGSDETEKLKSELERTKETLRESQSRLEASIETHRGLELTLHQKEQEMMELSGTQSIKLILTQFLHT